MSDDVTTSMIPTGTLVEVATHFTGTWTAGFEVLAVGNGGCRLRRLSDGAVLPAEFAWTAVRRDRSVATSGSSR